MSITIRSAQTLQGGLTLQGSAPPGGSLYFNGSGYIVNNTVADIVPGTGDFTVEWFQNINPNSSSNSRIWEIRPWNHTYWGVSEEGSSYSRSFYYWDNGGSLTSLTSLYPNQQGVWLHAAIVRRSGTLTLYINGSPIYSVSNTTNIYQTDYNLTLGGEINNDALLTGYITNFRITHNAQYTAAFRPPIHPLTAVNGTVLLMLARDASSFLEDSSGLEHTWTQQLGGVTWSDNTPF